MLRILCLIVAWLSAALTILWLALMLFFAFGIKTIEEKDKPDGI